VVGGDDVGFAAFEGSVDAEEADNVGVIGVEELARVLVSWSVGWNLRVGTYRAFVR